jgi:hypothetical protein
LVQILTKRATSVVLFVCLNSSHANSRAYSGLQRPLGLSGSQRKYDLYS